MPRGFTPAERRQESLLLVALNMRHVEMVGTGLATSMNTSGTKWINDRFSCKVLYRHTTQRHWKGEETAPSASTLELVEVQPVLGSCQGWDMEC
eukprot:6462206-Amphidinium_carterae.1